MNTRAKTQFYLMDSVVTELCGSKLPSFRQVFGLFLHLHLTQKKTIRSASSEVIRQVSSFWEKAKIPTRESKNSVKKLENFYQHWIALKRHRNRSNDSQILRVAEFVDSMEDLFDIAHADALNIIKNPEDRDFLLAQREKGCRGTIGPVDMLSARKEQQIHSRAENLKKRRLRADPEQEAVVGFVEVEDTDLGDLTSSSTLEYKEMGNEAVQPILRGDECLSPPKRAKVNIMTKNLAATLDRAKVSSRHATFIIAATTKSLGHSLNDININHRSIHRYRERIRMDSAYNIKQNFTVDVPLVVHWDGKLMENLTNKVYVDRLPVVVTGEGISQLIGVPKIPSGTGEAQSSAVKSCLDEWNLTDKVVALCFDTTASNTGPNKGACHQLEKKLKRNLLYLPCRHHILEVILSAAFQTVLKCSSGPEVLLFKRFREKWNEIDKNNFQPSDTDDYVERTLASAHDDILAFANMTILEQQPRDDFREFLELSIIFLNGTPTGGIHFRAPGALHHARWMSKVIYALKIWMFRGQIKLT